MKNEDRVITMSANGSQMRNAQMHPGMLQHGATESPRPSSVDSTHSSHSSVHARTRPQKRGGFQAADFSVGEEVKIALDIALERFRLSEEQKHLEFPSSLTSLERAYIHSYVQGLGYKSQSRGKGSGRYLTVYKTKQCTKDVDLAVLNLVRNSRCQVHAFLQRFPLSHREKQELLPRTERAQFNEGMSKELGKGATGRLNTGVAQVPSACGATDLRDFAQTLPVFKMKETIMKSLHENRVFMVAGETGSGKTTQVPQMILDDCHDNSKTCRIFCTQPRRLAALTVAERVAAERGENVGQTVGYQIRLESRVSPKTILTFCTNGVLLRTLMSSSNALSTVTHIIVDEIHERDRFSDFLLIALRDLLPKFRNLRLILMSAALNVQLFSAFFSGCPVVHVPGKLFDVEEFFLEDVLKLTKYTTPQMLKYTESVDDVENKVKNLNAWCLESGMPGEDVIEEGKGEEDDDDEGSEEVTPTDEAAEQEKSFECVEECEDLNISVMQHLDSHLQAAWLTGQEDCLFDLLKLMVKENVSVDYGHSETSATALMIAAGRGHVKVVEQLLQLGANVNHHASNEWTAFDWARRFQRTDILEILEAHVAACAVARHDEAMLVQQSSTLTTEDRSLLKSYHHAFDDDMVDLDLTRDLLYYIHSSQPDGAILVFLPGYDDIVTLRDMLHDDHRFLASRHFTVFTLHSQMESNDQKKVFKTSVDFRKIILATNIAETSITINDVVYVVDSGKVKMKSFDALTSVSMLKSQWVSKASALQRKGRAGRCQPGKCFHLFSRIRYDSMMQYQEPEILRMPLQELCLHAKLLAPTNCSIADFLSKAPEPPAFLISRNAVHLLKQMDALDSFEDLTELGHHLADLPVEPKYGKMILYAVVLKCLDPILTIACSLAYKDPFVLPSQPWQKRAARKSRVAFSADTYSDHMALLRAFQGWQKAKSEGWERGFCSDNFLSSPVMEMITAMRTQLLGQLRASGFVRARGGGDIRDLNTHSGNWAVVKAALTAGSHPNIIRVDRKKGTISSVKVDKVSFHTSSVLDPPPALSKQSQLKRYMHSLPSDWMIYEEMTRLHRRAQVKGCTLVSAITIALFAGPAKLSQSNIKEAECSVEGVASVGGISLGEGSDSDVEDEKEGRTATFRTDDWLAFSADPEAATLAMQLRQKWHSLFLRRMRTPSKPCSQVDENVIRILVQVLTFEDQAIGLPQPAGIGQKPRPISSESSISSGGSRRGSYASEFSDDSNDSKKQRGSKKGIHMLLKAGSSDADSSCPGSLTSSLTSSPCASPLLACEEAGDHFYVVLKAGSHHLLDVSQQRGLWATSPMNEKKLNKAFLDGKMVILIFSVQGSGHFQGYAKMTSPSGGHERVREFSGMGIGDVFPVEWKKRVNLPFQLCHHLHNPWNENRKVQMSRDGQDVEPSVGDALLRLWDTIAASPSKPSTPRMRSPGSYDQRPWGPRGQGQWGPYGGGQRRPQGRGMSPGAMTPPFSPVYVSPVLHNAHSPNMFHSPNSPNVSPVMVLQRTPPSMHSPNQPGSYYRKN